MTALARPTILLPALADALDNATARSRSWRRALTSALYTIDEVAAGPEWRLVSNVQSLAVGGVHAAEQLLLPALEGDDADRAFVAAIGLLEGGGAPCSELLVRLGNPVTSPFFDHALGLTANPQVERELRDIVAHEKDTPRLAAALGVLAFRGTGFGSELGDLLSATEPVLLAAALRAARGPVAPGVRVRAFADGALPAAETAVRDAAIELGLVCGSRLAWRTAQQAVESIELGSHVALLVLAFSGESSDVLRLAKLVSVDQHRSAALFALGFSGSVAAIGACLAALDEPGTARVAAEAFSAITGLKIEGQYCIPEDRTKRQPPISFEEDDLDANLVPGAETELPVPAPAAIKQWWAANKARFKVDVRYLRGAPLDAATLLDGFRTASTRRRGALGLELEIRTQGKWRVETRQWARMQLARQAAAVKTPVMLPFGQLLNA